MVRRPGDHIVRVVGYNDIGEDEALARAQLAARTAETDPLSGCV
jgi:hypothetical protein